MVDTALEQARERKNFYRNSYRKIVTVLLIMIFINIFLSLAIYYFVSHRPEPNYFATSESGEITAVYPVTAPIVSSASGAQ
jgi:intracellular multiplication protein IcmL